MFPKLYTVFLFFFLASFATLCQGQTPNTEFKEIDSYKQTFFKYDLETAKETYELPAILKEVSGLGIYQDSLLVCIQDEMGVLFFYGIESKTVDYSINFSADGDYEGVECIDETIYALRADGVLFRVMNWDTSRRKKMIVKVLDTPLDETNNTEGLAYNPIKKNLLIACKGKAEIAKKTKGYKNIYPYDFENMVMDYEPAYIINRKEYKKFVKKELKNTKDYEKLKKNIKRAKKASPAEPSAIAVHPITKHIYILAAVGNNLIILNQSGNIKHILHLPPKHFEQPEGISFMSNGDMFISSEAKKGKSLIFRFNWDKN
ncbi:MAG: hypothetical protein GY810_24185 [Aureispira sp.]|nr:hypothetical protein [Aureispira sp.]